LPELPERLLRVCRLGCCRTTFVCGAAGTGSGSDFLPNPRSSPRDEPSAEPPLAPELAFAFAETGFADPDDVLPEALLPLPEALLLAAVADLPAVPLDLAAVPPGLAAEPLGRAVPPDLPAVTALPAALLLLDTTAFPVVAGAADAPTVSLPTIGRLRNRMCCCPSVQMLVVTQ